MKKLLSILIAAIFIYGCKEESPFINYEESKKLLDTTYVESTVSAPQQKAMILEDVSGVKCVNCPDAAIIANSILNAFPGRSYAVVMHPNMPTLGSFVDPITKPGHESKYDFRTDDAKIILEERLGIPNSLPIGAINRRLFSGKTSRLIGRQEWYVRAEEELQTSTPVNIELKNELNESTGEGVVTVTLKYTQAVADEHYLTILLVEDSLIDVQESQNPQPPFAVEYINDYVHMHVLRDVITSPTGDPVAVNTSSLLTPGRVFVKQYAYKLKVSDKIDVVAKNAKLLALVHKDNTGIDVVHVNEIHVTAH